MKNLFILLLIILVFFACALIGYQGMMRLDQQQVAGQPEVLNTVSSDTLHYFVLIEVDSLTTQSPNLSAVWFLSLYLTDVHPPTVAFHQIYPAPGNTARNAAIEKAFLLNAEREPGADFWKEIEYFDIGWEGYMMVDGQGFENVFAWLNSTEGLDQAARATLQAPADLFTRMQTGCLALTKQSVQPARPFDLQTLFPDHLRSNLRMEKALAYWDKTMNSGVPIRCEVYLVP